MRNEENEPVIKKEIVEEEQRSDDEPMDLRKSFLRPTSSSRSPSPKHFSVIHPHQPYLAPWTHGILFHSFSAPSIPTAVLSPQSISLQGYVSSSDAPQYVARPIRRCSPVIVDDSEPPKPTFRYSTDKSSNPTLIQFLERGNAPGGSDGSDKRSSVSPEDVEPVRRGSSCSRLSEMLSGQYPTSCSRENKSSNEADSTKTPAKNLTLKRRILEGISKPQVNTSPTRTTPSSSGRTSSSSSDELDHHHHQSRISLALPTISHPLQSGGEKQPWELFQYYSQLLAQIDNVNVLKNRLLQPHPPTPSRSPPNSHNRVSSSAIELRKRSPRALTGKHVRLGTGASPTTLLTLRQKIEARQRAKAAAAMLQRGIMNAHHVVHRPTARHVT